MISLFPADAAMMDPEALDPSGGDAAKHIEEPARSTTLCGKTTAEASLEAEDKFRLFHLKAVLVSGIGFCPGIPPTRMNIGGIFKIIMKNGSFGVDGVTIRIYRLPKLHPHPTYRPSCAPTPAGPYSPHVGL